MSPEGGVDVPPVHVRRCTYINHNYTPYTIAITLNQPRHKTCRASTQTPRLVLVASQMTGDDHEAQVRS